MKSKSLSYVIPSKSYTFSIVGAGSCSGNSSFEIVKDSYTELSSVISYDVGRRKNNRCHHITEMESRGTSLAVGGAEESPIGTCWSTESVVAAAGYEPHTSAPYHSSFLTMDPNWRGYSSRAVQAMWPEVETRVSLANTLVELPEVLKLTNAVEQIQKLLSKSRSSLVSGLKDLSSNYRKRKAKESLSALIQGLSGSALLSEFALRPLLLDLSGIAQVFQHASNDVKRLLENEHKPLVSHYRQPLDLVKEAEAEVTTYTDAYGSHRGRWHTVISSAWYNATMRYSYRLLDYQREQAHQLGRWDALGLNLDPSIIWNAIPWSFVVDWFARVGDFLSQARIRNIEPIVSIDSFCHSFKVDVTTTHFISLRHGRPRSLGWVKSGSYRRIEYLREPYVPDTYTAIKLSGLNTREFILGGALIATRR